MRGWKYISLFILISLMYSDYLKAQNTDVNPPLLLFPISGETIQEGVRPQFRWTPPMPIGEEPPTYNFLVYEILDGQTPSTAMRANQPIVTSYNLDNTFTTWPENIPLPEKNTCYAWVVESYDFKTGINVLSTPSIFCTPGDSTGGGCLLATLTPDKGPEIALGMHVDEPGKFLYPRAVPMRAEGIDWDFIRYECPGCGGNTSIYDMPVRDEIKEFKWTLISGEGSLESPFKANDIDKTEKQIDSILKEIARLESRLSEIPPELDSIPKQKAALDEKIRKTQEAINRKQRSIDSLQTKLDSASNALRDKQSRLDDFLSDVKSKQSEITETQKEIDSLQAILEGKPSSAETTKINEIAVEQDKLTNAQQQLNSKEEEIARQSDQFTNSINSKLNAVETAATQYNVSQTAITAKTKEINDLESRLFANPNIRSYLQWKQDYMLKLTSFLAQHPVSNAAQQAKDANAEALKILTTINSGQRTAAFGDFSVKLNQVLASLSSACSQLSGNDAVTCRQQIAVVQGSADSYRNTMQGLSTQSVVIDQNILNALNKARDELRLLQSGLNAKKDAVNNANSAYLSEVNRFNQTISTLENQKQVLKNTVDAISKRIAGLEAELQKMKQSREDSTLLNREKYLEQINVSTSKIRSLNSGLEDLADSISSKRDQINDLNARIAKLQGEINTARQEKSILENIKTGLENQKTQLDQKERDLKAEQKRLQDELKAARALLDSLKAKLTALKSPSKTAVGPYAYYIPPPLENIMNRAEFERLLDKVEAAEDSLKLAYARKEQLQSDLTSELFDIGNALVEIQQNKIRIKKIDEDLKGAQKQLDSLKTNKSLDKNRDKDRLNRRLKSNEDKLKEAEDAVQKSVADSADLKKEIKDHRKLLEKNDSLLKEEFKKLQEAEEDFKTKEQAWIKSSDERIAIDRDIKAKEEEIQEKEKQKNRDQNDVNRARSLDDIPALTTAQKTLANTQKQIDDLNNELQTLRSQRASKSADEDAKLLATQNAKDDYDKKSEAYDLKQEIHFRYIKKMFELNSEYENALTSINQNKKLVQENKTKVAELENAVKNNNVDSLVNNDDAVKKKASKVDGLNASKKQAEDAIAVATRKIDDAKLKKDQKTKKVEEDLQKAKDSLEDARKKFHDFLVKEFENVKINVVIKLEALDKGDDLDQWRSKDGTNQLTTTLTYQGRTPLFANIDAKPTKPDNREDYICLPFIEFDKADPPEVTAIATAKREPRTIALAYKKGEPLWKEWPVIPQDEKRILAKDVVVLNAGVEDDKDQMSYTCKPLSDEKEDGGEAIKVPGGDERPVTGSDQTKTERPVTGGDPPAKTETEGDNTTRERGKDKTKERGKDDKGEKGESTTGGDDEDEQEESGCAFLAPVTEDIVDLGTMAWSLDKQVGPGGGMSHHQTLWEPSFVPKPKVVEEKLVGLVYTASELAEDEPKDKTSKIEVHPGVLIEVPDSLIGRADSAYEIQSRIVTGDHKGLAQETVEYAAVLKEGNATGFGFETTPNKAVQTDGDGYAKVKFNFGKGYAKFEITVKWMRGGQVVDQDTFEAISPIRLQMAKVGNGPAEFAWNAAIDVFKGSSVDDALFAKYKFPDKLAQKDKPDPWAKVPTFIAGIVDEERKAINDYTIEFKKAGGEGDVKPASDKTRLIGIARTTGTDIPDEKELEVEANVEVKYQPVSRPKKVKGTYGTSKAKRFKIGVPSSPFVVEADEEFDPSEPYTGSGKLAVEVQDGVLLPLKQVKFTINNVVLEQKGEDDFLAVDGSVSWKSESELKKTFLNFEFTLDSLFIYAHQGAGIAGQVKPPGYENAVAFEAVIDPDGNFLGTVSQLPAKEIGGFKLKEGASLSIDMHASLNPPGSNLRFDFMGVYIPSATIELPEEFSKASASKPTTLHAKDFSIGRGGVSGEISLTGDFIDLAYAGYEFKADSVAIKLNENSLEAGTFKGSLKPGGNTEGEIGILVSATGSAFTADISTDNPVYIRRLATTFSLRPGTGLNYDRTEKIGTLSINASISSRKYGDMDITGFELKSDGSIKAENLSVNKAIKFGKGFELYVNSISFSKTKEEYSLGFDGKLGFFAMGEIAADIKINPGPSVTFKKVALQFDKKPVSFDGELSYETEVFKGSFKLGIQMGSGITRGISGEMVIGTQAANKDTFTYWYVELAYAGPPLPLGTTGLGITEIGGGVGYHYNPPIGSTPGSPSLNTTFGLKAITGIGNVLPTPGSVFNSRLEMVLVPGKFSLYGKVWLLTKEESLFGEGQINLAWEPAAQIDGYVRMFIGLPDKKGSVFLFNGQINYSFPKDSRNRYVWSEDISGSFLQKVNATASLEISDRSTSLNGELTYNLNKEMGIGIVSVAAVIDVKATGSFLYTNSTSTLNAAATFNGNWDVDLKTPLGNADLLSGNVALALQLKASPSQVEVKGSAKVSWNVWVYSGSTDLDVGYSANI
ncbi:MAG: hypothetical protein GC181_07345 [Bacteroidetes bacterium]|nr:hypothetical protein [Bacteroidota bacterium]